MLSLRYAASFTRQPCARHGAVGQGVATMQTRRYARSAMPRFFRLRLFDIFAARLTFRNQSCRALLYNVVAICRAALFIILYDIFIFKAPCHTPAFILRYLAVRRCADARRDADAMMSDAVSRRAMPGDEFSSNVYASYRWLPVLCFASWLVSVLPPEEYAHDVRRMAIPSLCFLQKTTPFIFARAL